MPRTRPERHTRRLSRPQAARWPHRNRRRLRSSNRSRRNVLQRVAPSHLPAVCAAADEAPTHAVEDEMNAALGCKTSEVALAQIVGLEHASLTTADETTVDRVLAARPQACRNSSPRTATEAMLAV